MPILIAVLLLSAASVVASESPSGPNQEAKTQTPTGAHSEVASPARTSNFQPSAAPSPKTGATYIYNQYKYSSQSANLPAWLGAIATVGLVIFAGWQMCFVRRSAVSMEGVTEAARNAADTAERALVHAERAWLAFEVVDMKGWEFVRQRIERLWPSLRETEDSPTLEIVRLRVHYRLDNCGRTPARLIAGDIQLICADPISLPGQPIYADSRAPESLLPPGLSATNSQSVNLYPPRFEQFAKGRESLIIFGYVRYRDVVADPEKESVPHESRFRMECRFPQYARNSQTGKIAFDEPIYFQFAGPEAYNRYT
jgi:hypothetical protein